MSTYLISKSHLLRTKVKFKSDVLLNEIILEEDRCLGFNLRILAIEIKLLRISLVCFQILTQSLELFMIHIAC